MLRSTALKTIATLTVAFAIIVPAANAQPIDSPAAGTAPASANQQHAAVVPNEGGFSARSSVEDQSSALPIAVQRSASGTNPAAPSNATNVPSTTSASSSSFDWGDAGIGAAAMLLLVSVGAGGVVAIRRSRGRGQPALTA